MISDAEERGLSGLLFVKQAIGEIFNKNPQQEDFKVSIIQPFESVPAF